MQIKNHFDELRQSINDKETEIIYETTAEATRIRKLNNETKTDLNDLQALLVRDSETAEKRKNMNDIDLYNTGIGQPCFFGLLNIEGQFSLLSV